MLELCEKIHICFLTAHSTFHANVMFVLIKAILVPTILKPLHGRNNEMLIMWQNRSIVRNCSYGWHWCNRTINLQKGTNCTKGYLYSKKHTRKADHLHLFLWHFGSISTITTIILITVYGSMIHALYTIYFYRYTIYCYRTAHAWQPLVLLPVLRTAFPRMHPGFTAAALARVKPTFINTQKCSDISHTNLKVLINSAEQIFRYES